MSDYSNLNEAIKHDEALDHASDAIKLTRDILHKVVSHEDYHSEALMLLELAQKLSECAGSGYDCSYEHEQLETTPNLAEENKPSDSIPTGHLFVAVRQDQLSESYTPRGYRTLKSYCESFETVEEAFRAVKSNGLRPFYVAEMKENGECAVIYVVTKHTDAELDKGTMLV